MQSFLQLVAHDLYTKIGNDLSRTVLVFPNKRANLFFNEYLAGESDQPIWSPAAMSISDLFRKLSVQKAGDPIRLVCELYKVFREETESQETLDDFYFWGELLISDFPFNCLSGSLLTCRVNFSLNRSLYKTSSEVLRLMLKMC